jgi:hypothetical protein
LAQAFLLSHLHEAIGDFDVHGQSSLFGRFHYAVAFPQKKKVCFSIGATFGCMWPIIGRKPREIHPQSKLINKD